MRLVRMWLAALAGWVYEATGSYGPAFFSAALMGFLAAGMSSC